MQFIQVRRFPLTQLQTAAQGFPCEYLKVGHIDWDFSLTIAHVDVRRSKGFWIAPQTSHACCHSERSEA
jgi:hypothetical protein